jgi:hypothetical protein
MLDVTVWCVAGSAVRDKQIDTSLDCQTFAFCCLNVSLNYKNFLLCSFGHVCVHTRAHAHIYIYICTQHINEVKLSVNHSYLSLDLFLFILFNYINFGNMFRHQVPSSGQYYVMTAYPYNALHKLISLWDPTMLSLLQSWKYLILYVIN